MTLNTGQILQGRYHVLSHIGQGGMGTVYQAQDSRLGNRPVAIKEFDPSQLPPTDRQIALQAFQQEAAILSRISHPGLTAVHDYFLENNNFYLVMEFVEGETLQQAWERVGRRFSEAQVVAWARELCDVLGYLHSQQPPVIFRDLKPGNIMVQPNGHLKLIDFGIARHFTPGKTSDTVKFGTPGYAAPEQYGQGQTDPRSDIYSLGVVTHQLLTGYDPTATPFNLPPISQLAPQVSSTVSQVITQALEMDPVKRPSTARSFDAQLHTSHLARQTPGNRQKAVPGWVWGLVGVLVLFLLGGGWLWYDNRATAATIAPESVPVAQVTPLIEDLRSLSPEPTFVPLTLVPETTPKPTTVVKVISSTPTPTPSPTPTLLPTYTATATFTPEPVVTYAPLSLSAISNGEMDFTSPPNGILTFQNIPFDIGDRIFKSQASPEPHNVGPTRAFLTTDLKRAFRLYLLLNTGNGFVQFSGRIVGKLDVICDEVRYTVADLELGRQIREWHSASNVVSSATQTQQVWEGPIAGHTDLLGHIDMLTLDLPLACQNGSLTAVELIDTSVASVQSLDPALNLIAITVEYHE